MRLTTGAESMQHGYPTTETIWGDNMLVLDEAEIVP